MGVQDIVSALYGTYIPANVYSFEFRKTKNDSTICEIFLLLPPESVTVTEGQRAELLPTIGGGYYSDYGNEFKDIRISTNTHFFFAMKQGDVEIDGYTEFMKIRFMLSRYRDYTLTRGSKLIAPNFAAMGLGNVEALRQFADRYGGLADDISVVWHDYDYDDHFYIKVDSFSATREKRDPFSVQLDIAMKAYQVDHNATGAVMKKPEKRQTTAEWINDVVNIMKTQHPESMSLTVPKFTPNDTPSPIPSMGDMEAIDIPSGMFGNERAYTMNIRLRIFRSYLEWAIGMIQSGVMSADRALTQAASMAKGTGGVSDEGVIT